MFRFLFKSFLVALFFIGLGSFALRAYIIKLLTTRSVSSSSMVMSRSVPIVVGTNLKDLRFYERLRRLGFIEITATPTDPKRYSVSANEVAVYLPEFVSARGVNKAQLATLKLQGDRVSSIHNGKSNIEIIWLPPEPLTLLGEGTARVSSPRKLADFPKQLIDAILAIEDERFYYHFGIDPVAVSRALLVNLRSGKVAQGGSTLTQQLAKNLFFSNKRSLLRKAAEAIAAILIESGFTKEQILEFYLNEVFLGQEGSVAIHGFNEASLSFFGKPVEKLTLEESATLAGIIKAPTALSPRRYGEKAAKRRAVVLDNMVRLGHISKEEANRAKIAKIKTPSLHRTHRVAPYFTDYLRKDLEQALPGENSLVQIETTLDREYQQCGETAVSAGLTKLEKSFPGLRRKSSPLQAALLSVTPTSGDILAWVGGREYRLSQFDRVSQALRQPGSAFKPFVYLTALDKNRNHYKVANVTSILDDKPLSLDIPGSASWSPENYDKAFRGEVTVREALEHSLNIPTVNLAMKVGLPAIKETGRVFGFGDNLPAVPSLALGAGEVTPLALARAYSAIANGGSLIEFRSASSMIVNGRLEKIKSNTTGSKRVTSEGVAFVLTNILRGAVERGTGQAVRNLGYKGPAAGKTGTTNDGRDAWFAGFTPHLLTVVWVGFDDNHELNLTGAQAAVPIWTEYMKCVAPMEVEEEFLPPSDAVFKRIDKYTALLATSDCPKENVVTEVFVKGTEPTAICRH